MSTPDRSSPPIPIRRYMLLRIAAILLFTVLAFAVTAAFVVVRPAQDELARLEMALAAERVESVFQLQARQGEQVLGATRDLSAPARARLRGPEALAHVAISQMRNRPFVLSMAFARDDGVAVFVNRDGNGFRVRELDARGGNRRQRWTRFDSDGRALPGEQFVERAFDARERPWFKGALAVEEGRVFITEPFAFFEDKVVGITFAVAERDRERGATWVVAANVSLRAVTAITSSHQVGRTGGIALLTRDGRLIGLPRDPAGAPPDLSRLLRSPQEAGLEFVGAAFRSWRDGTAGESAQSLRAGGRTWLVRLRPLQLGTLGLLTATFADRDDFALGTWRDVAALLALTAGALLLALAFAHRFSQRFGGVIRSLAAASERMGALELDAPVKIETRIEEVAALVSAQERMRALLLAATRDLEERVKELTALHETARLLQGAPRIDEALLERFAARLPAAFQFPQVCEARVRHGLRDASTPGWRETAWRMTAAFATRDGRDGALEVAYREARPFLDEEQALLSSLAEMLAAALDREHAAAALEASHRELEDRVAARTVELAEREALTRTLYESSPSGLSLATPRGEIRHISRRWTDIIGYTQEEIATTNARAIWAVPGERDAFIERINRHGHVRDFECRFRRKSGETFSALLNALFVEIGGEKLIASWAHDITELKAVEQALADALQRQRSFFAASPHGIAVFQGRECVSANPAFDRMFGYPPGGMIGQGARALFVSQDEYERIGRELYAAAARGEVYHYEGKVVRKDGAEFWCRASLAPLAGADDSQGVVGVYEDITARKEADDALQAANAEVDAIFRSASLGIVLTLAHRVRRCNRRAEEMFGYGEGELVGAEASVVFKGDDEDYGAITDAVQARLSRGETHRVEKRLARTDGGAFWCRIAGRAIEPGDPSRGFVWMLEDVSDEHAAAEALREAKRIAEEATQAKSMFLASMSHEIRTPMNGVLGLLQLLALSRLDAGQKETLEGARESARSLLRIIDDVLDFSKIEAGRLEIRAEPLSVAQLVESVRQTYSGVASAKGLDLRASVDAGISPALGADPLRLRQILNNLVSNAIKFTDAGHVEIAAALDGRADGRESLRFSVADTGIGVTEEAQARLFQPYAQAAADTARQFGGTGLGLSICRRLAEAMGGTIAMRSAPGRGTTMTLALTLPVADARALPATGPAPEAELVEGRRDAPGIEAARAEGSLVLVVEDHRTNRNLLVRLLAALGYAAETAENGREALAKWRAGRFGAIVTDCNMPGMDGYALARAIREEEAGGGARVPIVACTANALAGEAERCLEAGMDAFVAKPIELEALARAMDRWLPVPGTGGRAARQVAGRKRSAGAPVDRSSLAAICGGDASIEREVLADFRLANDADLAELRRALEARDLGRVTRASHRVQGACKMVGAMALARVCERMEGAGRRESWADVAAQQAALEREAERLNRWLDAHAAAH